MAAQYQSPYQQQLLTDLLRPDLLKKTNFANQLQARPTYNQAVAGFQPQQFPPMYNQAIQGLPQQQSLTDLILSRRQQQQKASPPPTLLPPPELSRARQAMMRGGGFLPTTEQQQAITAGGFKTQADLDAYKKAQNAARFQGIGNLLMGVSDAFAGRNIGQGYQARETSAMAKTNQMIQMQEQERLRKQRFGLESTIDEMIKSGQMSPAMGEYAKADPSFLGEMYKLQKQAEIAGAKPPTDPASFKEYMLTDPTRGTPITEKDEIAMGTYSEFLAEKRKSTQPIFDMGKKKDIFLLEAAMKETESDRSVLEKNKNVTDRLYLMELLLDGGLDTGRKEDALLGIRSWLNEFGNRGATFANDLAEQELFDALSAYIVPRMREIGSGATSDFEAKLYQTAIASLKKTPKGNKLIVKFMLATVDRDRKLLELKNRYIGTHDNLLNFNADLRRGVDDLGNKWVEPELFRKFDMRADKETGIVDFDQAVANGELKEGQMYYNKEKNEFFFYGFEPLAGGPSG